jgi:DeoR family fructose operon transcriptional repressor
VDTASIANELQVTTETIRKDLIQLERQGLLRRVHGGAIALNELSFEPNVAVRIENSEEKDRIARAALAYLPSRGSILLDAGSTSARLAELLPAEQPLTVYTNALPIAMTLLSRTNFTVFTLGGRLRAQTIAEVDDWALRALAEINVDVAFLGANGISVERGLTTPDPAEAAVKHAMVSCARTRVLLADHSKVGLVSTCKHADLADIDIMITDDGLSPNALAALRQVGLTVVQA